MHLPHSINIGVQRNLLTGWAMWFLFDYKYRFHPPDECHMRNEVYQPMKLAFLKNNIDIPIQNNNWNKFTKGYTVVRGCWNKGRQLCRTRKLNGKVRIQWLSWRISRYTFHLANVNLATSHPYGKHISAMRMWLSSFTFTTTKLGIKTTYDAVFITHYVAFMSNICGKHSFALPPPREILLPPEQWIAQFYQLIAENSLYPIA
jgi:hypothetical protein